MRQTLSTPKEILQEIKDHGGDTVQSKLDKLVENFTLAVRAVDPSVQAVWVGCDGPDFKRPFYLHLQREDSPFNRRVDQ
jgi:hypothetical protein